MDYVQPQLSSRPPNDTAGKQRLYYSRRGNQAIDNFKIYYRLTKPGIVYGNALTASAGFFLASRGYFQAGLYLAMLAGLSLVIASACVLNNCLDRQIDQKMARTKNRALAADMLSVNNALFFATSLGFAGFLILGIFTNWRTTLFAGFGFVVYVAAYSFLKRRSVHGTLIGSLAGAVPPVVGYLAVTNRFNLVALLLFVVLVSWQMPHFYAIAIYRLSDYKAAGIPVLPIVKGIYQTQLQIFGYMILFIAAAAALASSARLGLISLVILVLPGAGWLIWGISKFKALEPKNWARRMFLLSLIVITCLSLVISVSGMLS